jgi:hypothetical protein
MLYYHPKWGLKPLKRSINAIINFTVNYVFSDSKNVFNSFIIPILT